MLSHTVPNPKLNYMAILSWTYGLALLLVKPVDLRVANVTCHLSSQHPDSSVGHDTLSLLCGTPMLLTSTFSSISRADG